MTIEFDKPKNEFPKTVLGALLALIAAVLFGCFLGDGVAAFLGTNMDYDLSNRYSERMNAVITWFSADMEPLTDESGGYLLDENGDYVLGVYFQRVGQVLSGQGDTVILRSAAGEAYVASTESPIPVQTAYDADLAEYLENVFLLPDCLDDTEDAVTGEPIDDVLLYHITVIGETVYYYVYYDAYGYIAIVYDPTQALGNEKDVVSLSSAPGWYVVFAYES